MTRHALCLLLLAPLALSACGGDDDSTTTSADSAKCAEAPAAEPKEVKLKRPPLDPPPEGTRAVFATNCGSFTVELDTSGSPKTAASFAFLVEEGVYDGTGFHRVVPAFVIQGGDPAGDGTGGPGYSVTEPPPANTSYREGMVAMAKTEVEPPGTSGSQFYVVTAPDAGLPPEYAVVGEVVDGDATIRAIEELGTDGSDGPPSQPVVIEKATLEGA
jgi:peptidyl-prolyl cis-trans isomerase B (cyclophilin B)